MNCAGKIVDLLFTHLIEIRGLDGEQVRAALQADYLASGARGKPLCLAGLSAASRVAAADGKPRAERQARHLGQQAHRDEIQKAAAAA